MKQADTEINEQFLPARTDQRIKSRLVACIRHRGHDEEAVCENLSEGGLSFRSRPKPYSYVVESYFLHLFVVRDFLDMVWRISTYRKPSKAILAFSQPQGLSGVRRKVKNVYGTDRR